MTAQNTQNTPNTAIENIHIEGFETMPSPDELHARLPLSADAQKVVLDGRKISQNILDRKDHRLMVVVGPCSIHDPEAGLDYARRLKKLSDEVSDTLFLVMRVYFEKPRTTVGWKGYINDPYLNDSFAISEGMAKARRFLLDIAEIGLPSATEVLDPISPQFLGDLMSWTAIGARTTESQTHREISSGLSTPVGFKNGTNGDVSIAVNAILSASRPHSFLGVNGQGAIAVVRTSGNPYGHVVLRGGNGRPNYDTVSVQMAERALVKANLAPNIMVDCSHSNSYKKAELQGRVLADVVHQIKEGDQSLIGVMIESNIIAGAQKLVPELEKMTYGQSVTDACIDWESTEKMLKEARAELREVLPKRMAEKTST